MKALFTLSHLVVLAVLVVAAPATAEPRPTCEAMCRRLTDCKLPGYIKRCLENCKPYEASAAGRAQILAFTRYTCRQIHDAVAGDQPPRASETTDIPDNDDEAPGARGAGRAGGPDRGAKGARSIRDDSRRPAGPSDDNCAPVCDRFAQCKLWTRDSCMGYCSAHTSDPAKNLSAAQWSCPRLGAWKQELGVAGSGRWTCVAEGSSGMSSDSGPMSYDNHRWPDTGRTREEASRKALEGCDALVRNYVTVGALTGSRAEAVTCRVVECQQTGR